VNAPRVYFHCCEEEDNFQSDIIPIAEGLRDLGIQFYSRANYWRQSEDPDDYLFRATPDVRPEDCDIVIFPFNWFCWCRLNQPAPVRREFPELLTRKSRSYRTVLIDDLDGYETVSWEGAFRQFDLILRTKFNERAFKPSNLRPWAIGLSKRMLLATARALPYKERKRAIFVSYNASHPYLHTSRTAALEKLHPRISSTLPAYRPPFTDIDAPPSTPYEALMWRQTNSRHSSTYYERLGSVAACSAFCGEIVPALPFHRPQVILLGGNKAKLLKLFYRTVSMFSGQHTRILSCDSFRFWETLAAGSVAFNVEFEKYGVLMPVMPRNWEHYIGVDFESSANLRETSQRLKDDPGCLERIASQGRAWALEHYSPVAQATRLLRMLGFDAPPRATVDG
jgi:hypothetical protein